MAVVARKRWRFASAQCLATDTVGDFVYIRDEKVGRDYVVGAVDPTQGDKMPAVAFIVEKSSPTACTIMFQGYTSLYSSLVPGDIYVVGSDSRPARAGDGNYPVPGMLVQQIGVATGTSELLVNIMDVLGASGPADSRYYQQPLVATPDPRTLQTSFPFKHGGVDTEVLLYNGQRLLEGSGNDYVASESAGVGSGYDTITLEFAPAPDSNWSIDYVPDL